MFRVLETFLIDKKRIFDVANVFNAYWWINNGGGFFSPDLLDWLEVELIF